MKAWSVIGLLFAAAILATVPVSPQVTPRGVELSVDAAAGLHLWACAPHHAARGPARLSLCPTGLPARLLTGLLHPMSRLASHRRRLPHGRTAFAGASCRSSVWVTTGGDNGVS